ncbi:trans-sulfuration enzyme family protein [Staphylococcus simulans]|uniref:trans-sulfuration enzyme family protein n=1 Tax=Staphylococcus simulans TaxID=1286 RepID=UPI00070A80A0|nr:PLP-dependent aspartate aminotransferase family protein [Staphylococcus simulans]PTI94264.1 PLP-dependent transferase [Staphylococcus simulans]PTJ04923.1 PLP-dependent transferase [Staphylococcus simulans]PTJ09738.1 PLP-dependent transferase [Staphylococcus simulans]PTJ39820.1 PLP-dependent transferase [Staphylococcus simulans]PTJ96595.1 PLP-dependent transferase [Staphylococcus simulans]
MSLSSETNLIKYHQFPHILAANPPLYDSSTFPTALIGSEVPYDYARSGHPNRALLEEKLAALEDAEYGIAYNSGIGAISAVFFLLKSGDHLIIPNDVYGGTYRLCEHVLPGFNIEVTAVDTTNPLAVEQAIQENTKLIHLETPSNPLFKVTDIQAIADVAKKHNILVSVDNTFLTPLSQKPLHLGADIVIHSATKFLSGHSDLIAGAVVTNNAEVAESLQFLQNTLGSGLSAQDSWTLTKHLKTLYVRWNQSVKNTEKIVEFLKSRPEITDVYYPGNDEINQRQAENGGAVLGFRLREAEKVPTFAKALKIPQIAVSLGGIQTIVSHPATMSHASVPEDVRNERGITFDLLRLSVGLEDPDELIADFEAALEEAYYEPVSTNFEQERISS